MIKQKQRATFYLLLLSLLPLPTHADPICTCSEQEASTIVSWPGVPSISLSPGYCQTCRFMEDEQIGYELMPRGGWISFLNGAYVVTGTVNAIGINSHLLFYSKSQHSPVTAYLKQPVLFSDQAIMQLENARVQLEAPATFNRADLSINHASLIIEDNLTLAESSRTMVENHGELILAEDSMTLISNSIITKGEWGDRPPTWVRVQNGTLKSYGMLSLFGVSVLTSEQGGDVELLGPVILRNFKEWESRSYNTEIRLGSTNVDDVDVSSRLSVHQKLELSPGTVLAAFGGILTFSDQAVVVIHYDGLKTQPALALLGHIQQEFSSLPVQLITENFYLPFGFSLAVAEAFEHVPLPEFDVSSPAISMRFSAKVYNMEGRQLVLAERESVRYESLATTTLAKEGGALVDELVAVGDREGLRSEEEEFLALLDSITDQDEFDITLQGKKGYIGRLLSERKKGLLPKPPRFKQVVSVAEGYMLSVVKLQQRQPQDQETWQTNLWLNYGWPAIKMVVMGYVVYRLVKAVQYQRAQ